MEEALIDPLGRTAKLRMNLISEVYNKYRFSVDECSHEGYLVYLKNNELPMLTKEEKEWVIKLYTRKAEINKLKDPVGPKETCTRCNFEALSLAYCTNCIRNKLKNKWNKWESGNEIIDKFVQSCQMKITRPDKIFEWIPFKNFINIRYKTRGGFGKIYTAEWINGNITDWDKDRQQFLRNGTKTVILKSLDNSHDPSEYFFREAESHFNLHLKISGLVWCYGITKNPSTNEYMLVLKYWPNGDLGSYLKNNSLSWKDKILLLIYISTTLHYIHQHNFIHKDLHPGNILLHDGLKGCNIGDLGFCGPADEESSGKIYGILPYIAPEVLQKNIYSTKSDIYSLGMIMWELAYESRPFGDRNYDEDLVIEICHGERPPIFSDIPTEYIKLTLKCWDANPDNRPDAIEIKNYCDSVLREIYKNEWDENKYKQTRFPSNPNLMDKYISKIHMYKNLPEPKNSDDYDSKLADLSLSLIEMNISKNKHFLYYYHRSYFYFYLLLYSLLALFIFILMTNY